MRGIFIVFGKLLGIYLLYSSATALFGTLSYMIISFNSISNSGLSFPLISSAGSLAIVLIFSFLLIFKTSWLAIKLKIETNSKEFFEVNSESIVKGGIVLLGLYIFSTNIGKFVSTIYFKLAEANMGIDPIGTTPRGIAPSKDLLTFGVTIALSVFMIFGSKTIEKVANRKS